MQPHDPQGDAPTTPPSVPEPSLDASAPSLHAAEPSHVAADPAALAPATPSLEADPLPTAAAPPPPAAAEPTVPTVLAPATPSAPVVEEKPLPPVTAAPAESKGRRWGRRAAIAAGVLVVLLIFGPWLLSVTVLTAVVRGALGRGEQEGALGKAELSWSNGIALDRLLVPSGREADGPRVLLDRVVVDVPLASAAFAAVTGGTVPVRLVVGHGRVALDLPADLESGEPAEADPEPEPEPGEPGELPCGVTAEVVVEGLDLDLSVAQPNAAPLRLAVRGLKVDGGAAVARSTALDLPRGFSLGLDELRLDAPGVFVQSIVATGGTFRVERLALAAPDAQGGPPPLERLDLLLRIASPHVDVDGTPLRDVALELEVARGTITIRLQGAAQGGRLELTVASNPEDPLRIPTTVALAATDVQVGGVLARALPYILPLLHATDVPSRTGPVIGLPPVTLRGQGTLELLRGADGSPRLDDTLRTLAAKGDIALAPGSLAASRAIDGYMSALLGLGVASQLDGLLPANLKFDGGKGTFEVAAGGVKLSGVDLRSELLDLRVAGEVTFDGVYRLNLRSIHGGAAGGLAAQVVRVVDAAGGITIEGDLQKDTCAPVLPDEKALAAAAQKAGLPDVLRRVPLPLPR